MKQRAPSKPPNTPRGLRLFAVLWAAFTVFYAVVIVRRFVIDGDMPGLATAAGVGAVISVWLYLYDLYRNARDTVPTGKHAVSRQMAILVILGIVLIINVALVLEVVRRGGEFPFIRAVLTFGLTLIIRHVLAQLLDTTASNQIKES